MHAQQVHALSYINAMCIVQHEVVDGGLEGVFLVVSVRQMCHRAKAARGIFTTRRPPCVIWAELLVLGDALEIECVQLLVLVNVKRIDLPLNSI